jgi:hypothetical protein
MTDKIKRIELLRDTHYNKMQEYNILIAENLYSPKKDQYYVDYLAHKKAYKTAKKCLGILVGLEE